jgi:hypothetical protein
MPASIEDCGSIVFRQTYSRDLIVLTHSPARSIAAHGLCGT